MNDSKINILKSIKDAPKSTKALHEQFPEFLERADLSAYLGNLYRTGFIKKRTNGYWALLAKGEVLLQKLINGDPESDETPAINAGTDKPAETPKAEPAAPIREARPDPAKAAEPQSEPAPATNESKMWAAIQAVQAVMDEGQKLIIEEDKTYFVFASRRFAIASEDDLAAAIRVAGMYAGVSA